MCGELCDRWRAESSSRRADASRSREPPPVHRAVAISRRRGVSGARTVARRSESVDLFMASARMRYGPRAMKPGNEGLSRGRALVALALTSALIVAHEVLITRLLSVVTWYGLAFVVLSIAMLGLTAGSLQAYRARELDEPIGPWIARRAAYFAVAIVGSTGVTLCVPLTPDPSGTALAALLAVAGANAIPMTLGGGIVARIMAESDAPVGIVYAVDLVAAALGALSPLVILGPLDGPSALIILGAFAALIAFVASPTRWMRGAALGGALALALIGVANNGAQRGLRVRFVKTAFIPLQVVPFFQGWNALSNIFVYPPGTVNARDALWAPSVHTPTMPAHIATAQIDGEAGHTRRSITTSPNSSSSATTRPTWCTGSVPTDSRASSVSAAGAISRRRWCSAIRRRSASRSTRSSSACSAAHRRSFTIRA